MAKVHILDQNSKKDTARCTFHVAVPDQNNAAGVSYRAALVEYLDPEGAGISSQVPNLDTSDPTEDAQIKSGEVYEHSISINFDANLTNAQKADIVDAKYLALSAGILAGIQDRLKFWGMTRNPT
jgi:hypothetical protein